MASPWVIQARRKYFPCIARPGEDIPHSDRGLFCGPRTTHDGGAWYRKKQISELLDLHARAELEHLLGRKVEVVGEVGGVARHAGEHAVAPARHATLTLARQDLFPRDEERGLRRLELQAERRAKG